jgi:hypothetical protein
MDVPAAITFVIVLGVCAVWLWSPAKEKSPERVLRSCRASLWMIQHQLEHLPATRPVCEAMEKCGRLERRIDREESRCGIGREGREP